QSWAAEPCADRQVGPLFAGGAVDRLPDEIGMAVVPGVLLDHVHDDPAQARALTIRPAPGSESVQVIGAGERIAGARHCLLPQGEVLRGGLPCCQAPFPVRVDRPVGPSPRLGEDLTEEHAGEPVLFYPGQMGEDPPRVMVEAATRSFRSSAVKPETFQCSLARW